ncbi:MAG: potassium channel protein [Chitinophagales bacterium]|nr:potassium channel protein [Chitinophagales bacterium]MDW8418800.1 NAD-binding protein [Chitinophagales bacterium]
MLFSKLHYSAFYKLYLSIAAFFVVLGIGTCGYVLIEDYPLLDAVYMTVITLATVGFMEVHPLSNAGKIFTIFIILINIGTFTYFISQLTSYFLDGEFIRTYKSLKMKSTIEHLRQHTIICGFGRNGREAAKLLYENNQPFVVIEPTPLNPDTVDFPVRYFLHDDATRDEVLEKAGVQHAGALITTLPNDADNLLVVLTARELNPSLKIISRASNDSSVRKLKTAGANNVIMPDKIGGAHMATLVLSPDVKEFVDVLSTSHSDKFMLRELECTRHTLLSHLDAWKKTGATVLGIRSQQGEYVLNPPPDFQLSPGQRLIVMGSKEQIEQLSAMLHE